MEDVTADGDGALPGPSVGYSLDAVVRKGKVSDDDINVIIIIIEYLYPFSFSMLTHLSFLVFRSSFCYLK